MQDWSSFLNAIGAVVVALGGKELIQGWLKKRSGKAEEERTRVKDAWAEAEKARDEAEKMRTKLEHQYSLNRIQREYSSALRRLMIESGIPVEKIPDWPNER